MSKPNLPDLRRRILADEEIPLEELRAAVEYQYSFRLKALESKTAPTLAIDPNDALASIALTKNTTPKTTRPSRSKKEPVSPSPLVSFLTKL